MFSNQNLLLKTILSRTMNYCFINGARLFILLRDIYVYVCTFIRSHTHLYLDRLLSVAKGGQGPGIVHEQAFGVHTAAR